MKPFPISQISVHQCLFVANRQGRGRICAQRRFQSDHAAWLPKRGATGDGLLKGRQGLTSPGPAGIIRLWAFPEGEPNKRYVVVLAISDTIQ